MKSNIFAHLQAALLALMQYAEHQCLNSSTLLRNIAFTTNRRDILFFGTLPSYMLSTPS
jgi:hypothetical protein